MPRNYKEDTPHNTIRRIREILAKAGILAVEQFWCEPYPGLYSVRLSHEAGCRLITVNGKGRTKAYCLASAYGELIERLQHMVPATQLSRLNMAVLQKHTGYCFFEDEVLITPEQFLDLPRPILDDFMFQFPQYTLETLTEKYFQYLHAIGLEGCPSAPFVNIRTGREQLIPYELLYLAIGSNGMAAGNTIPEAAFQALNEVIERWAIALVFFGKLTPPIVPREILGYFPDELAIIDDIESSGKYEVRVMDFSAGLGLPVLGVMVKNKNKDLYRLNVACETSFQVALSRGLTEVFQGLPGETVLNAVMLPIPRKEAAMFLDDSEESRLARSLEFFKVLHNMTGHFPMTLFGGENTYAFDPNHFLPESTYKEDLANQAAKITRNGHDLYFRSSGFMGFPTVIAYVPGVSRSFRKDPSQVVSHLAPWEVQPFTGLYCRLKECSAAELGEVAKTLDRMAGEEILADVLMLEFTSGGPCQWITVSLAESWIQYSLGNFSLAKRAFERYLSTLSQPSQQLLCIRKWLELAADNHQPERIAGLLRTEGWDTRLVEETASHYSGPERVFSLLPSPRCPDCEACSLADVCLTRVVLRTLEEIRIHFRGNAPTQDIWKELFASRR